MTPTTIEQIQQLVQELGPSMPEIDAIVQTEEPSWAIQFSDETIIILEATQDPPRIVVSAELGAVADAQQEIVYETLLCYNMMWRASGGIRIGLAGPQGALIISTDIHLANLTQSDLQQEIEGFLKITRSWAKYIAQSDQESQTMPPLPDMGASGSYLSA